MLTGWSCQYGLSALAEVVSVAVASLAGAELSVAAAVEAAADSEAAAGEAEAVEPPLLELHAVAVNARQPAHANAVMVLKVL
jgi:hypothetical protein